MYLSHFHGPLSQHWQYFGGQPQDRGLRLGAGRMNMRKEEALGKAPGN